MEASETGDSLYVELLRQWLQNCDQTHPCDPKSEYLQRRVFYYSALDSSELKSEFWPTRVIFVGDSDSSELKLLETKSEQNTVKGKRYIALSHCWGKLTPDEKRNFCTTRENYQDRLNGFSIDDLPRTFQDAVRVTRAIGKKFLWIDALCIIQEDYYEWETEAKSMEQVFSSAYCTIAADSARNWKQGFLRRESPPRFTEVYKSGQQMYTCDTKHDFENDVNNSELNKRAWVLQERVLSRRILHFTENHTYFACGTSVRCENFMKLTR